ncbi:MAG: hypothetical protein J6V81_01355 [Bacteroidales bacterium]|nr:hypothetical protein [Bacteroidales bacterium]
MKTLFITSLLMIGAIVAGAQDKVETSLGTDIVSHYVWRGQDLGGVSVQPSLGISYKGVSLSAWGSEGLSNPLDTRELDFTLAYEAGGFNIGVTDYWFPEIASKVFEANIGYDFGFASLQWFTNFAGDDSLNDSGKPVYSSYVEASIPFSLGGVDWTATVGAVPFATDFYGVDSFAFINLGLTASKDIQVTDSFSIPVFAQLAANPYTKNAYLVFGITLEP